MIYEQIYEIYKRSVNALRSLSTSSTFENKEQEVLLFDLWFMKKALSKGIISSFVSNKIEDWNSSRDYYYYKELKESEVDQISLLRRYPLSDSVVQFLFEKDYHQLLDILECFESTYLENMWRVLLNFWKYKFEKLQHLNLSLFYKYSDIIKLTPLLEKGIFKVAYILKYRIGYSEYSIPNDFEELLKILKKKGYVLYESMKVEFIIILNIAVLRVEGLLSALTLTTMGSIILFRFG